MYPVPADELLVEFTASSGSVSELRLLFHKQFLIEDTQKAADKSKRCESLDWDKFHFVPILYDAKFDDQDPPYWQRQASINECLGPEGNMMCVPLAEDAERMLEVLLEEEGLVCHRMARSWGGFCGEQSFKINIPKVVLKARISALANTLDE